MAKNIIFGILKKYFYDWTNLNYLLNYTFKMMPYSKVTLKPKSIHIPEYDFLSRQLIFIQVNQYAYQL